MKRVSPRAKRELADSIFPAIARDPYRGTPLTGPLRDYWKYRVSIGGVSYRVGYVINTNLNEAVIIAIGARGGFYERIRRRINL